MKTGGWKHRHGLLGHLNRAEMLSVLSGTSVLFLRAQETNKMGLAHKSSMMLLGEKLHRIFDNNDA